MGEHHSTLIHTIQFAVAGILLVGIFFLLSLIATTPKITPADRSETSVTAAGISNTANAVTAGLAELAGTIQQAAATTIQALQTAASWFASTMAEGAKAVGRAIKTAFIAVGRGLGALFRFIGKLITLLAQAIGACLVFIINIPGNVASFVVDSPVMSAVIKPADTIEVPIIDPNSPELKEALAALPAEETTAQNIGPQWPVHGMVTTEFGVPHRPYQVTHSGMDIADGTRPGTTPVHPFRPGRVIDVVHQRVKLGNNVVVDHGNGVTSVYAHLDSISVTVGQEVGLDTVLGLQGTTGVSTGTHLHFEIRVHGQAADPRHFISGQPSD